jgi:F-type H+-transporting ATPase subunit b
MRWGLFGSIIILGALLGLLSPAVAFAAKDDHAAPSPHGGEPGGTAAHDPVDNPFAGWLDLTIWTILVFLLLLWVLSKYAWKPMLAGLEKREHAIHSAAEDAQKARDEAQRLRDQLQQEMNHAQEKVRALMDEARKNGDQLREQMVTDARKEIQGERERLHREVESARDQALQQITNQTADLAALISSKVIRRQMTPEDHRRLVDEALGELRQAGADRQRMVASLQ